MSERMNDDQQFLEAELARLADGSLPPARAAELRERVAGDPVLAAAFAEQQRAVSLLAGIDTPAPSPLRARVDTLAHASRASRGSRGSRRSRAGLAGKASGARTSGASRPSGASRRRRSRGGIPAAALGGALTALGAAAIAITVLLSAGGTTPTTPTMPQTVHLALAAATLRAPVPDPQQPAQLELRNGGVPFPNWATTAGWSPAGARADTVGGRRILTVFYTRGGSARIGYAIVSGSPLQTGAGRVVVLGGVRYTLARSGSAVYVTWVRSGHTCVIAGAAASSSTLLYLASDVA